MSDDLDDLFTAPPSEFIERRKELAKKLRKEGHKDEATRVASLPKPTPAAFLVNSLHREHREEIDALLEIGERLREALRASFQGAGDAALVASLQRDQHQAVAALVRVARALAGRRTLPSPTPSGTA